MSLKNGFNIIKNITAILLFILLFSCIPKAEKHSKQGAPIVTTSSLISSDYYYKNYIFTGIVSAREITGLSFELAGKISDIKVDVGDKVEKGQLLASLDLQLLNAQQSELFARLKQNATQLALAERTLKRSNSLKENAYISSQQLDEITSQQNNLLAEKQALKANLKLNSLKLKKSSLYAPFSGVVSHRECDLGTVINQGQAIMTLANLENPQAHIGVSVKIARELELKQPLTIDIGNQSFQGVVAGISSVIDPVTHTVEVRFLLPKTLRIFSGEIARLNYQQNIAQSGFWVPLTALTQGVRGRWNMFLVNEINNKAIIQKRDIEIIHIENERAFVSGAISQGEKYLSQGLHKFVNGQQIRLDGITS